MQPSYLGTYRALVTSTADKTQTKKIKVVCPQLAGIAEFNWAEPIDNLQPLPNVGDIVWLTFSGGDTTKPVYTISANPYGWQTPNYLTGWTANNQFAGLGGPPLRFRKTDQDELYLYGNTKYVSGGNNFILTLPTGYYNPNANGMSGVAYRNSAGTITTVSFAIDVSTGTAIILPVQANGDEFLFNVRIPMKFVII